MADEQNTQGLLTLVVGVAGAIASGLAAAYAAVLARRSQTDTTATTSLTAREQRIADSYDKQLEHLESDVARLREERDAGHRRIDALQDDLDMAYSVIESLQDRLDEVRLARDEALEDAFNVRTIAQGAQTRHDVEKAAMLAELNAAEFRARIAALWIASARRVFAEGLPDLPPAPYWIEEPPTGEGEDGP